MLKQPAYASLMGLACLVAVYVPTFVLVSVLIASGALGTLSKDQAQIAAIPLVILISAALALAGMAMLARRRHLALATYGFKTASLRQLALALGLGLLFALGLRVLSRVLPLGASADLGDLRQRQVILFFWMAAPVQEETIFRGLVQTVVALLGPDLCTAVRLSAYRHCEAGRFIGPSVVHRLRCLRARHPGRLVALEEREPATGHPSTRAIQHAGWVTAR